MDWSTNVWIGSKILLGYPGKKINEFSLFVVFVLTSVVQVVVVMNVLLAICLERQGIPSMYNAHKTHCFIKELHLFIWNNLYSHLY